MQILNCVWKSHILCDKIFHTFVNTSILCCQLLGASVGWCDDPQCAQCGAQHLTATSRHPWLSLDHEHRPHSPAPPAAHPLPGESPVLHGITLPQPWFTCYCILLSLLSPVLPHKIGNGQGQQKRKRLIEVSVPKEKKQRNYSELREMFWNFPLVTVQITGRGKYRSRQGVPDFTRKMGWKNENADLLLH